MAVRISNDTHILQEIRVLVVEDEFFVALHIEAPLQRAGAEVVGPFSALTDPLAAVHNDAPSLADLDVTLLGTTTEGVCDAFAERKIPFIFHSDQSPSGGHGRRNMVQSPLSTSRRERLRFHSVRLLSGSARSLKRRVW